MTNKERTMKLKAVVGAFAMEMEELGMSFSAVAMSPEMQTEGSSRLFFLGNVSLATGKLLMEKWLEMADNPKSEVLDCEHVRMNLGDIT